MLMPVVDDWVPDREKVLGEAHDQAPCRQPPQFKLSVKLSAIGHALLGSTLQGGGYRSRPFFLRCLTKF
jgi:hypothetical protein